MSDVKCLHCGRPSTTGLLDERCQTTLAIAIVNVSAYHLDTETIRTKTARYGQPVATRGSVGKTQPLPIDARFAGVTATGNQIRYDVWATVVAWCRVVMEEQPELHGPAHRVCIHTSCTAIRRRSWPANRVQSMCAYLLRQQRWITAEPWCAELLDEMLDCENRLRRLIDRPVDRWYAGKCECGTELYALDGQAVMTCEGCGLRHDVAAWREALLTQAAEVLVTATEGAAALVTWASHDGTAAQLTDQIRTWHRRGLLEARGTLKFGGRERTLFRLGDIGQRMLDTPGKSGGSRQRGAS